MPLTQTVMGDCPGGWCQYLLTFSEVLVVLLLVDGFIFLVTLIPQLFSWKTKKPDSKKRVFFAAFACLTFYFWLTVLAIQSLYCFGFLAHAGPCLNVTAVSPSPAVPTAALPTHRSDDSTAVDDVLPTGESVENTTSFNESVPNAEALYSEPGAEKCSTKTEQTLKNVTLVNFLIVVVLIIVIAANINEVLNAKALYYQETLCRKEDIQRFLSNLVTKRPEVGHFVKCFHISKSADAKTNSVHKVVTYSTVENFEYQTWKDFSDLRLIDPTKDFPVIEVEIVLNFFPGDHATAERYKEFVQKLTRDNTGKDTKISIDDYFHIEDQREWTFFAGNKKYIVPWYEKDPARFIVSCVFLFGWPFRLSYSGKVAKHRIEVKKAVFCENASQDEGVSLTATPGSSTDGNNSTKQELDVKASSPQSQHNPHEQVVDVQVSSPPPASSPGAAAAAPPVAAAAAAANNNNSNYQPETPLLNRHHHSSSGNPPMRSAPMASPRTHLRETTKDIVTAVTHHDINGMNAVSTVALKDIDVQMSALSGYETYV